MDNWASNLSIRKALLIVLTVLSVFAVYNVGLSISRHGKTPVDVSVAPSDSQVYIDGEESKTGTVYMTPGRYIFTAVREDFKEDKQTVDVANKPTSVELLPTANTAAGRNYIRENVDVQAEIAAVYDKKASKEQKLLQDANPLLSMLPYTDIENYFSIDYGASETRKNGIELIVTNSTSEGRLNALKWIRQQGLDPTNFEIKFVDFDNPLASGG